MKKHKIFISTLLTLCIGAVPIQALTCSVPAMAYTFSKMPEIIEYNNMEFAVLEWEKSNELILLDYNGNEETLIVPETVEGKTVTAISQKVLEENKTVKNVTLPDTIDYFESSAFAHSFIESINIPKSLRIIPNFTFGNCTNLKSVEFHDDIMFISKTAFENTSIQIPSGIKSDVYSLSNSYMGYKDEYGNFEIQVYADRDTGYKDYSVSILSIKRKSTNDIVIPETINGFPVKKLNQVHDYPLKQAEDNFSISNIFEVNSIEFPKYLNDISTAAFKNRTKLTKIIINSPDIKIADNAFANTGIEELNLHGSCNIGKNAFADCKNLKSITIDGNPETVEIGNQAFQNCTSLEKIIIPDTCENTIIGRNAFKNTGIKQLEINSNCTIGIDAFSGCPMESVIINSENAEISLDAFADCENLRELKLSKGCKLSQNAFMDHTALENINIDISESITGSAFNGCENLTSINGEQVFDENTGDFVPKYKDFIMKNFNLADDIGFINQYVQANVKKIVAENITSDMNDMQKVRTLHDWVCSHTSYSPAGQESHNDAAILMNDTTVCEGYSRLCNLLYHEAGLETYYVTGVNHAWNIVKIDNHYFHVDSTWDDSNDEVNYKWFCKSDSEMKNAGGYHASWKTAVISSIHDFQENISPECNYQIGDMNTDNEINIADMVKLEKYILNAEKPDNNLVLSDLNFDGITDVFDVIEMRRKITE